MMRYLMKGAILGVVLLLSGSKAALAANFGDTPAPDYAFTLSRDFSLPPFHMKATDAAGIVARGTQVFQRAQTLGIDATTADQAWHGVADTITKDRAMNADLMVPSVRVVIFAGSRFSGLQRVIAAGGSTHIVVTSRLLEADTPLVIAGKNLVVDFSGAKINPGPASLNWLIRVEHGKNISVVGAVIDGGTNGILVENSSDVVVSGNKISGLAENGVVVTGSSDHVVIADNHIHGLNRAGIMLDGDVRYSLIEDNQIYSLNGHSNWNAAILLTGRSGDIGKNPSVFLRPDVYWVVSEPIVKRLKNPMYNVILGNDVRANHSSGIYNDGAVANVFLSNRIEDNSKEGICFDNGATANVFVGNIVTGNGDRWGQTDKDLAHDFVAGAGRLADGTPSAKLPGVSIDNALYNEIFGNYVVGNFGGGVKMVRTGIYNIVGENVIISNNLGESPKFHFFGIELGAAPGDNAEPELNFTPSVGNIIFGNNVRGKHYSGIFFGPGSVQNDVFDNQIFGVEFWAMESVKRQDNYTMNNLTVVHSRNISPGVVANLGELGAAVFDKP